MQALVPEAVEIVPSRPFPNPEKGKPPIVVKDVAVVDKNVLFMHNVGAIQALAERQRQLEGLLSAFREESAKQQGVIRSLEARLEAQASEEVGRWEAPCLWWWHP